MFRFRPFPQIRVCSIRLPRCDTGMMKYCYGTAVAAMSVSSSSCSFLLLTMSSCSSNACLAFQAAARAKSAALSASALRRLGDVELLEDPLLAIEP